MQSNNTWLGSVLYLDELTIIYCPLGSNDQMNVVSTSVFPNPMNDEGMLYINASPGEFYRFDLYDMLGNKVMSLDHIAGGETPIRKGNLPAGIYHYSISNSSGITVVGHGKMVVKK